MTREIFIKGLLEHMRVDSKGYKRMIFKLEKELKNEKCSRENGKI